MLGVSVLLAVLPLVGIGLMFYQDPAITVDNLFVSLMLLTISGVFLLNASSEMKQFIARKKQPKAHPKAETATATQSQPARSVGAAADAGLSTMAGRQRGIVREVQFFESPVGMPSKSIVTLQLNGANSNRMFAFEGDLRNALPVGKKVEISFRDENGALNLQNVNYV